MSGKLKKRSKYLSLVLRHQPEAIGLQLDANGWADVDDLMARMNAKGQTISRELLNEIVTSNDKQRFAFSEDGKQIRANQGHSITVDLALESIQPPETLYHGTATRFEDAIRSDGLVAMSRQHVHLSAELKTAVAVGQRHGKPYVLVIRSTAMAEAGYSFYQADNGVWLTKQVPVEFIEFPETEEV